MVDMTSASSIERIVEPDIFGKGRCSPITLLTSASAKRSICCGAGCEFWTLDRVPEPAVMPGYCGDPLEYCHTGVLWCWGGRLFAAVWMELSEIPDIG